MGKQFAFYGTVSSGTMRSEDLIPAFLSVLGELSPRQAKGYQEQWAALAARAEKGKRFGGASRIVTHVADEYEEAASELCEDLFDALDGCAPEGFYFGAHPGAGADYGFWQYEEEGF